MNCSLHHADIAAPCHTPTVRGCYADGAMLRYVYAVAAVDAFAMSPPHTLLPHAATLVIARLRQCSAAVVGARKMARV